MYSSNQVHPSSHEVRTPAQGSSAETSSPHLEVSTQSHKSTESKLVSCLQHYKDLRTIKMGTINLTFTLDKGQLVYGFFG